jgi:hypothetical protein
MSCFRRRNWLVGGAIGPGAPHLAVDFLWGKRLVTAAAGGKADVAASIYCRLWVSTFDQPSWWGQYVPRTKYLRQLEHHTLDTTRKVCHHQCNGDSWVPVPLNFCPRCNHNTYIWPLSIFASLKMSKSWISRSTKRVKKFHASYHKYHETLVYHLISAPAGQSWYWNELR